MTLPSCLRFQPGTNDRCVLATDTPPSGVSSSAITAARGSSSTIITRLGPGRYIGNRTEIEAVAPPASWSPENGTAAFLVLADRLGITH